MASKGMDSEASHTPSNPRGIPTAPFVDRIEDYMSSRAEVEPALRNFQEMITKYQFMEQSLQRRVAGLKDKLPDIEKTLETVRFIKARRTKGRKEEAEETEDDDMNNDVDDKDGDWDNDRAIETTFEVNDTLFARARIPPTEEVYLWLGANVMLSYPIDEAEALLNAKYATAKQSLANCEEDLDFMREQITTMEVATARVYNWDVVQKRKEREEEEMSKGKGKTAPNG